MKTKKEMAQQIERLESQLQEVRNNKKAEFNKYDFINSLELDIINEIKNGNIEDEDGIREYINSDIDNACIYYYTCFQIAMELNSTDFTCFDNFGEINNISQLAYAALDEYVNEELDINSLIELINNKETV